MTVGSAQNTTVVYKQIPVGMPVADRDFTIETSSIDLEAVELSAGFMLVRTLYISVDPYMRGRMRDAKYHSYAPPLTPGEVMNGSTIAEVLRSECSEYAVGDVILGFLPWQSYAVVPGTVPEMGIYKLEDARDKSVPLTHHLGVLGFSGFSAYVGLMEIGKPQKGETLYVSAAGGAVGLAAGQIGKLLGLRVVGSAGDDEKVAYLKEIGFDAAFNYKKVSSYEEALREHCPEGIDVYFENVGGEMLDAVLAVANPLARIAVCGMISQYNRAQDPVHIKNATCILTKSITVRGFLVTQHSKEYQAAFAQEVGDWVKEGKIQYRQTITEGIVNAPQAFIDMLSGKNVGKAIVKVADL